VASTGTQSTRRDYVGGDAIATNFCGRARELTGGSLTAEVLDILPGADRVILMRPTTAEREGRLDDLPVS